MTLNARLLYAGLSVLSRFPHVFNCPRGITEANARRQYTLVRGLLPARDCPRFHGLPRIRNSQIQSYFSHQLYNAYRLPRLGGVF